jgi:O-antigen/teichoic acid export membrane protein
MKNPFLANSLSGILQTVIVAGLTFVTIPVFINKLGFEKYGIFSLLTVIGSTNIFASFGLNTTLKRFLSKQGKSLESNVDILVSLLFVSVVSLIISLILFLFHETIMTDILGVPKSSLKESKGIFYFLIISNSLLLVGQMFEAIIDAQEKIYLSNYIRLLYNVMYWSFIIIVLFFRQSLDYVGLAILLTTLVWFVCTLIASIKTWGTFKLTGAYSKIPMSFKKQFSFTTKIYSAGLITIIGQPLTKVLISKYFGIDYVGFYEIVMRIRSYLFSLLNKGIYPIFPIIARSDSLATIAKIVTLAEQKIIYLSIMIIFAMIGTFSFLFNLWLPDIASKITLMSVLIISFHLLFNASILPSLIFFSASNYPSTLIIFNAFYAIGSVIIYLLFNNSNPLNVIIIAEIAALILAYFIAGFYQKKYLSISKCKIFDRNAIKNIVALILFNGLFVFSTLHFLDSSFLVISIVIFGSILLNLILWRFLKIISKEEIDWLFNENTLIKVTLVSFFIRKV